VEDYDINVNPATLPYPYTVQANGSFTVLSGSPTVTITGTLTSATTGVFTSFDNNPATGDLKKIMDLGACQGTWSGQLTGAHTDSFQIIVDSTGTITGGGGFTSPYGGKLFCESGKATGLVTTGAASPMDRIKFQSGTIVSVTTTTISGNYETNSGNGTYTLVK